MNEVLNFWFKELQPKQWWIKSDEFDKLIANRFGDLHTQAVRAELFLWRKTPEGRLAEIIVLDQFSRNIFRNDKRSFLYDPIALVLAQEAVSLGADLALPNELLKEQQVFFYMPYMHSESLIVHDEAVKLFDKPGLEGNLKFEHSHRNIIAKFGRYPHRNKILGRDSTPEELEFLKQPGSSF